MTTTIVVDVRLMPTTAPELLERGAPLRTLHRAILAASHGRGSLTLVTGEPGIGKSAVIARLIADQPDSVRVLVGVCDDLTTPRPLGPVRDILRDLPKSVSTVVHADTKPGDVASLMVEELRTGPSPTLLVLEDIHWADQATVDTITIVARRLPELPVVMVLTLRPGELPANHPLRSRLDTMRRGTMNHLDLAPLSRDAVGILAGPDAETIFALSQGNPFFVTELIAHGTEPPPPTLATAVVGRVARLDAHARRILELISVVPGRVPIRILDRAAPHWESAINAAEQHHLVSSDSLHVRFRHELARRALHSSLPQLRRRQLHRRILDALLELSGDPADIVHHAEAAGATGISASYTPIAAHAALQAGAVRDAYTLYARATRLTAGRLHPARRALLFEELSRTAWLCGLGDEARDAATAGMHLASQADDSGTFGRCAALRAHANWFRGEGTTARHDVSRAIASLEADGVSLDLARVHAQASQLSMMASRFEDTLRLGRRALELTDDLPVRNRALMSMGAARMQRDINDDRTLLRAVEQASAGDSHELAVFATVCLAFVNLWWVRPAEAARFADHARRAASEREFEGMVSFVDAMRWAMAVRAAGPVAASAPDAGGLVTRTVQAESIVSLLARTVAAELAVRYGAGDADELLDTLAGDVNGTGELMQIAPVVELQVERALLAGTDVPAHRFDDLARTVGKDPLTGGCGGARMAAWAAVCGRRPQFEHKASRPHAAMIACDWQAAADAFAQVGWHYDQGLMLSLLDTEEALTQALRLARSLRAEPLERRVRRRMRALGMTVPRGPVTATRSNPAQLTARQLQVLHHLAHGQSNTEIARLLHISPRTAEHHVAAILSKLGASTRTEAAAVGAARGII